MTKINVRSIAVIALALFGFMAASAQTTSLSQSNSSANSVEQISRQEYHQMDQLTIQKTKQVPPAFRIPMVGGQIAVNKASIADDKSVAKSSEQSKQPVRMEQLQFAKKQAADKGLPTAEYDAAMKEIFINQAQ
jgi:hypothetical protein